MSSGSCGFCSLSSQRDLLPSEDSSTHSVWMIFSIFFKFQCKFHFSGKAVKTTLLFPNPTHRNLPPLIFSGMGLYYFTAIYYILAQIKHVIHIV